MLEVERVAPRAPRPSRRRAVRRLIRQVHVYVGLILSLILFVLAVTGGALVYKEAYWRLVYPELRTPVTDISAGDRAAAVAAARRMFGDELGSVKMPEPGVGAYHLYLADGEAFLSASDYHLIDEWRPTDRVMSFLFDLHAHLMAGESGERVGGVVSLLGVLLAVTGLFVWWPARRQFRLAHLVPRSLSRRGLIVSHRDLGALASPLLILLLLTGGGIVFYEGARVILNGVFGDRPVAESTPTARDLPITSLEPAMVSRVEAEFPDARIVFYYPPTADARTHGFRLKQPCELHPNGRTYLYLDQAGEVVQRSDACVMPPGERAVHAIYPLHSGKTESGVYKFVVLLGAVALAALSLSGGVAYLRRLR